MTVVGETMFPSSTIPCLMSVEYSATRLHSYVVVPPSNQTTIVSVLFCQTSERSVSLRPLHRKGGTKAQRRGLPPVTWTVLAQDKRICSSEPESRTAVFERTW